MTARPFAYTNRDYTSLLADLRRRLAVAVPEWTSYDAGFESILLELFAYVGDNLNFYVDRVGAEAFLQTAVLRDSILNLAQMFDYTPVAQAASSATVQFTKSSAYASTAVTIPAGTQVFAQTEGQQPIIFEVLSDVAIAGGSPNGSGAVVEGITVGSYPTGSLTIDPNVEAKTPYELLGMSDGNESQAFVLHYPGVIANSVRVFTYDGSVNPAPPNTPLPVEWTYFSRLIDADAADRAFTTFVDDQGYTYVIFGDNVSGSIPSSSTNVYALYRYGVGSAGNVGIGSIRSFVGGGSLTTQISSVSNTSAATGGADRESIESMRTTVSKSLKAIERAVSTSDYATLALQVPGVAKAYASASAYTSVTLYIAPVGGGAPSTVLQNAVAAFFAGPPSRSLAGVSVTVAVPVYTNIDVKLSVTVNSKYRQSAVQAAVQTAIQSLFAFDNRDFGEKLMMASVFRAVVDIPGVDYVTWTDANSFMLHGGSGTADIQLAANQIAQLYNGVAVLTMTGGVVLP